MYSEIKHSRSIHNFLYTQHEYNRPKRTIPFLAALFDEWHNRSVLCKYLTGKNLFIIDFVAESA